MVTSGFKKQEGDSQNAKAKSLKIEAHKSVKSIHIHQIKVVLSYTPCTAYDQNPKAKILLNWKQVSPPSHIHWIADLLQFLHLGKVKYTTRGSADKFYRLWQPFLSSVDGLKLKLLP